MATLNPKIVNMATLNPTIINSAGLVLRTIN